MTVLLVLLTAIVFLAIDYFYFRPREVKAKAAAALKSDFVAPRLQPAIVAGFELPPNLRYHPGHAWALTESPNLIRVGMDQFAARIIGAIEGIRMPQRGQWIRQGQKIWTVQRGGAVTEMASPIEGEVAEVNEGVLRDPGLACRDPYGEGWLLMVRSPDAGTNLRNLLSGGVARMWLEESARCLKAKIPALAGAFAQDGGVVVDDLSSSLGDQGWVELTREFFLT